MKTRAKAPARFRILSLALFFAAGLACPLHGQQAASDYGGPTLGEHGDAITPEPHPSEAYWISTMPPGPGKDLIVQCGGMCHSYQKVIYFSRPASVWREIIEAMIQRGGLPVTPDQVNLMVDYMARNYGPRTKPRGETAIQPCAKSEWPKGRADFRKPWGDSYTVWASEQNGGAVDIINPALNKVVRRITCISSPDRVEFSPDGNTAYIPDRAEWNDTIVDTRTGAIIKKIPLINRPNVSVLTRDGRYQIIGIWPVRPDEGTRGYIQVVDTASLKVVRTIEAQGGVHDVWMSRGGEMFLASAGPARFPGANHFMNAYDTRTFRKLWTCCTGPDAEIAMPEMEPGPDGKTLRVFVGYVEFPGIVVLDAKTGKEIRRVKLPVMTEGPCKGFQPLVGFHGNEVAPDGKSVWFVTQYPTIACGNAAYKFSLPDLKPLGMVVTPNVDQLGKAYTPRTEGGWLTISPDGKIAYVARPGLNEIFAIDTAKMKVVGRISTGQYPLHISIWPRGTP